ncbi:MAG: hypothetical protein WA268_29005 [Xanthobacteraceae bacterium]
MVQKLRIGIDFDNTIVSYDEVFCAMAKRSGLIGSGFVGSKQAVRDAVRRLPDGELAWQRLQGQVYSKGIADAKIIDGFEAFLRRCRAEGCAVMIVSHKTEYGHHDPDRLNLRQAARDWLVARRLFDGEYGISATSIFFESTRAEKLARIGELSCTHFIDDLEEVLSDPDFPPKVARILFSGHEQIRLNAPYVVCASWSNIEEQVFARG